MHAMILAAGRGERMRPLTDTQPKPLFKVGGKPLIEWHLRRLAQAGITRLVINHAWLGEQIEAELGDGRRYGVHIVYSHEDTPLETAGGIARALPLLGDQPFLVMNGDVWCDWDPTHAIQAAHKLETENLHAWLLLADNPAQHPEGDFSLSANGVIIEPRQGHTLTFTGIGVYHRKLFQKLDPDLPARLAPVLYQAIEHGLIAGQHYNGLWVDVGTPQRLFELDAMLAASSSRHW